MRPGAPEERLPHPGHPGIEAGGSSEPSVTCPFGHDPLGETGAPAREPGELSGTRLVDVDDLPRADLRGARRGAGALPRARRTIPPLPGPRGPRGPGGGSTPAAPRA